MSVLKANKKYISLARQQIALAENEQQKQADIDFRRNIVANIRQQRLAQSQAMWNAQSDIATTSGQAGTIANIQSTFAEPLTYTFDYMERQEDIEGYYNQAQTYINKYQKQAKTAAKWGTAISMGAKIAGTVIGGPIGYAIGSLGGALTVAALGGDRNAIQGAANVGISHATMGAVKNTFNTSQNSLVVSAQNAMNYSQSQYYGTSYTPIVKKSGLKMGTDKQQSAFFDAAKEKAQNYLQGMFVTPIEESGGTTSSFSFSRGMM